MHHRDLGIGVAVVAAALLMVTAGFAIGSRARSRQAAISSEPPVAAPAGTAAATTVPADAAGAGPGAAAGTPGAAGAAPTDAAGRAPVVGAPVPASGPLLAVPAAPARLAAGAELTCAQLGGRALGLVPLTCGRVGLAPSGRPVLWISGRVPDSQALQLQVWSFAGTGAWTQSLVATEPAPARTWAVVRVAAPALSPRGRTLLAQFRSLGPGALLAYDLVGLPVSGPRRCSPTGTAWSRARSGQPRPRQGPPSSTSTRQRPGSAAAWTETGSAWAGASSATSLATGCRPRLPAAEPV